MLLKSKFYILGLLAAFFVGCKKGELPIKPLNRGSVIDNTINVNSDYKQQVYFSLNENRIITTNVKTIWDLAFESTEAGFHIKLNGAKLMAVYNTGNPDMTLVVDTSGFGVGKKYDEPSGNLDSTGFGNWQTSSLTYIIDRGYNQLGQHQGFRKLQMISSNTTSYHFVYANLNGTNLFDIILQKEYAKNFTYFSFNTNAVVAVEPDKENFDLIFTQYTHLYKDPFSSYLVMGVLLNPTYVKAAVINDKDFATISLSDTVTHPLSNMQNTIGYDWKTYNFQTSSYDINVTKCYIIKDCKGFYYKLHFIDFYNSQGIKGYPRFEFLKL